jgi:hypothetical protein
MPPLTIMYPGKALDFQSVPLPAAELRCLDLKSRSL